MHNFPIKLLEEWFLNNQRYLPWRENPTPYRVWISEVMLQQTQVSVVIPYFERWMTNFPTISALASASLEEVIKCWEGLGYYARARNLHAAARYILENYNGNFPQEAEKLALIKGIGPYTQGAILSFAFRKKAAAVDGNVMRVISRFSAFEEAIDTGHARRFLQHYVETILPDEKPWLISEGLIELGATICTKKPKCEACPLVHQCLSFRHQLQHKLPNKNKRPQTIRLTRQVAVIVCDEHYLLQKAQKGDIMEGLYEFPYFTTEQDEVLEEQLIVSKFQEKLGLALRYVQTLPQQHHTFTRYQAQLFPHLMISNQMNKGYIWARKEQFSDLPFSSGHRRISRQL